MDSHVLRVRTRAQGGAPARSRLRPLAVYKPSFSLNNNNQCYHQGDDETQALLGAPRASPTRCLQQRAQPPPPVPARCRRDVAPSVDLDGKLDGQHRPLRDSPPWDGDSAESNCCCGAVALPWARAPPAPAAPPAPPPPVARAMNTHGIFSHGPEPAVAAGEPPRTLPPPPLHPRLQPPRTPSRGPAAAGPVGQGSQGSGREDAAVHRGAPLDPPWTGSGREMVSTASAAVDGGGVVVERSVPDDNEDGVVRRMLLEASAAPPRLRKELLPPLPPLASAPLRRRILVRTKPDIPSRLCSADAPLPAGHMDRFNKFRFGGRVGDKQEGAQGQGAPGGAARGNGRTRTSDKTERLRELTERLKGGSGGSEQRAAAPPSPSPSPSPSPTPGAASAPQTLAAAAAPDSPEDADLFDLRLARPESRAIVGSYIQRTIPFRSASFSQVDFSDGKYFRHSPRATWLKPLSAAATLPRKRTDDLSSHPSPTPTAHLIVVEPNESHGSTPSVDSAVESAVDSAVGSDEGCCFDSPVVTAKVPGSTRSMTHPLASRQARIETRPHDGGAFLSVDGLRHLVQEGDDVLSHTLAVDTNRLTNSTSSLSDVEAPATSPSVASEDRGDQTEGNLSPSPTPTPTPLLPPPTEQGDIKPLDNPVSYEVFVRQFPNYKEYEKWMNESVLLQNGEDVGDHHEWREQIDAEFGEHPHIPEKQPKQVTADSGEPQLQHNDTKEKTEQHLADQANQTVGTVLEHDDRCINNFDPSTCPKCLEQMETGPSILQKLKASFHMEDLELEPHEKELFSRHSDLLLRKWAPPTASPNKTKHSFERSKSEPKETLKEDAKPAASAPLVLDPSVVPFHRTKSTDEPERGSGGAVSTVEPPRISLPDDMKDATSRAPPSHQDMDELRRRRPKDEPRRWLERPKLICQSSDERDDESSAGSATPSRPRFPMIGRSDSLSEGESDQGDRRPSTPSRASPSLYSHLDLSDSEGRGGSAAATQPGGSGSRSPHTPRRYSKRPLRGPYGQMLEAEMKKPDANRKLSQYTEDLKFLEAFPTKQGSSQSLVVSSSSPPTASGSAELTRSVSSGEQRQAAAPRSRHQGAGGHSMDDSQLRATALPSPLAAAPGGAPKRKVSAVDLPFASLHPGVGGGGGAGPGSGGLPVCHQRTTSSPSQLEGIALRADMEAFRRSGVHTSPPHSLKEAAAKEDAAKRNWKDTRTHVVVELYETERSYVESLEFLVKEYMQPLKKPENAGMVDSELVEQIFYQVPAILALHQEFLDDLQKRLENWDFQQKVGDVLLNAFTKRSVIETYTAFINNWKTAKEAIKSTCQAKPAFARYLEAMAREHKGKLDIDSLLIKLVQRIPGYELLIQQLLKHTDQSHADHALLLDAQREIHELAVKINCTKMESLEAEQQQQVLRDLEQLVEGCDLVAQGRAFLRHDMVTLATGQGARKDRVIFLFSDLVVIARTKRNLRKPSTAGSSTSVASGLEGNRYRCSIKAALDDLEIVKAKDESLRRVMREMEQLSEDVAALTQITELVSGLHLPHAQQPGQQLQLQLEELARDLLTSSCRQLAERQNSDSQLSCLDLTVNTSNGVENITVIFPKPDKRSSWEEEFNEAKTRLALSADRRPSPKFKTSVPIRKTRAGLQFTCAAPTLPGPAMPQGGQPPRDVWVCNSDGYVGQVCVLSLLPEPNVTSCNGVCNARILCVAAIPAGITGSSSTSHNSNQGPLTNSKAVVSISVEDADKASRNLHLDSSSSSSDEDEDNDSGSTEERQRRRSNTVDSQPGAPPPSVCSNGNTDNTTSGPAAGPGVSSGVVPPPGVEVAAPAGTVPSSTGPGTTGTGDDGSLAQPTMWLGTEDGCIHVYSCNDNIRIKRNKVKIQHGAAVQCIMYFDNRVFVSLANGDITVYNRDQVGGWNTTEPYTVTVGSAACPVTRMVPISGRLWCSCQHTIKILNTYSLQVEQTVVAADSNRAVTYFVVSGLAVWLSVQNSAVLKLYHASTFEHLGDVNVAPAVTKMLASCDDIIRQHKAACLRVTSLLACKDLLWIGTSAGVILTMPLPHIAPATTRLTSTPNVLGVPHGHTGHVRFLTVVEAFPDGANDVSTTTVQLHQNRHSWKNKSDQTSTGNSKLLVISGGDGYEDFRTSSVSEVAGKEDSTNHLLMWQV